MAIRNPRIFSVASVTLALFSATMLVDRDAASAAKEKFAVIVKLPTSSPEMRPAMKAIVERVAQTGYEKLFANVTRVLPDKLKFYRHNQTPTEPLERTYHLEFNFNVVGEDNWNNRNPGDDWVEGILYQWTLSTAPRKSVTTS